MDDTERRERAAAKRAARERYMRENWPERWAEQQERNRARRREHYARKPLRDPERARANKRTYASNNRESIRDPEDAQSQRGPQWGRRSRATEIEERRHRAPEEGQARDRYLHDHWPQQWAELQAVEHGTNSWRLAEQHQAQRAEAALQRRANRAGREANAFTRPIRQAPVEQYKRQARMKELPLPAPTARRAHSADRRANEDRAHEFFTRERSPVEKAQLRSEAPPPSARARMRRAQEADAPVPLAVMERMAARVGSEQERQQIAGELHEEWLFRRNLPTLFARSGPRHEKDVLREVQHEQIGRKLAGKTPLDEEREVLARLEARVLEHDLTPEHLQAARAHARSAHRDPSYPQPPAPHTTATPARAAAPSPHCADRQDASRGR